MKLITRQSLANEAAERWKGNYYCPDRGWLGYGIDSYAVYSHLLALGENPDPDRVDAVIGNGSWTEKPSCDECGQQVAAVAEVGQPPDYESATARLCYSCASRAHELIGEWLGSLTPYAERGKTE